MHIFLQNGETMATIECIVGGGLAYDMLLDVIISLCAVTVFQMHNGCEQSQESTGHLSSPLTKEELIKMLKCATGQLTADTEISENLLSGPLVTLQAPPNLRLSLSLFTNIA